MNSAIERCLSAATDAVQATEDVAQWQALWRGVCAAHAMPFDRAVAGGFASDRVGWAFAAGYQAALRALVPGLLADSALAAFCVTEEAGNRPRDIATTITHLPDGGISIRGAKRWTTLGLESTLLLIAGREAGPVDERPRLRVALVPSGAPGLALVAMPPTRFVPEVSHARVALDGVRLPDDALLPGDGYARYVKPFRTIEDAHVTAAVLAYLLREARARGWPAALRERIVAALEALAGVAAGAADAPANHVLLAGALRWAHQLYAEAGAMWAGTTAPHSQDPQLPTGAEPAWGGAAPAGAADAAAARWQRDAALFAVAGAAREARAARAWERLASKGEADD